MNFILNEAELAELFMQAPSTKADGGFQSLMIALQEQCDRATGLISVTAAQAERIRKYAFTYGNGGWEGRLTTSFSRHLGSKLDQHDGT